MGSTTDKPIIKLEGDRRGLSSRSLLDKIDGVRELGIDIPLPQLAAFGDQSSGKSSCLESITGIPFPRDVGLCTRYATQIACRRDTEEYIEISIIPRSSAESAEKERLAGFHRRFSASGEMDFAHVFAEANRVMGLRSGSDDDTASLPTFTENILKIEKSGPNEEHLTVIDVPGIFRDSPDGVTTEQDIELVNNMVKNYMKDSRTIILAVMDSSRDIATQDVLRLAKAADPEGVRTLGVFTKPDLCVERALQKPLIDRVLAKNQQLQLGYYVVRNRGADDLQSTLQQRHEQESAFFQQEPWSALAKAGRAGIGALSKRLGELLQTVTKREFPHLKNDIKLLLTADQQQVKELGTPRDSSHAQRAYLSKLSSEFQRIAACALEGRYVRDAILMQKPEMRLITRIIDLNEAFAREFARNGHKWEFESGFGPGAQEDEPPTGMSEQRLQAPILFEEYPELADILHHEPDYKCEHPLPSKKPSRDDDACPATIMDYIKEVYLSSRGPELGTFGGAILETTFKEQAEKWENLVLSHVSRVIVVVHDFIVKVLQATITDKTVREALWEDVLFERLCQTYQRAMDHARFLLDVELRGHLYSYNHYFNATLNKRRLQRFDKAIQAKAQMLPSGVDILDRPEHRKMVPLDAVQDLAVRKSNAAQVCDEIHDILFSYYKVAYKRFVDNVCQQTVGRFLLNGGFTGDQDSKSPMKLFDAELVLSLDDAKLAAIAGEDPSVRQQRESVTAEIKKLEKALKILRG